MAFSGAREHSQNDEVTKKRGLEWLRRLYRQNLDPIFEKFEAHKDFGKLTSIYSSELQGYVEQADVCVAAWVTESIVYGLFLSDQSVLDPVETEIVVLSGIMMQNLPSETGWHMRGMRRIGATKHDVERIWTCVSRRCLVYGLSADMNWG